MGTPVSATTGSARAELAGALSEPGSPPVPVLTIADD